MSKRVLLKLSGESFADSDTNFGISPNILTDIANQISKANEEGIQIAVVVGGGNFFRGVQESAKGMAQANADYMGMLATVINAVALKDALDKNGTQTRVQSAITMTAVAEPYIRLKAIRHLEKGRIVIFRCWYRKSLFHYRYCSFTSCCGNRCRHCSEVNEG